MKFKVQYPELPVGFGLKAKTNWYVDKVCTGPVINGLLDDDDYTQHVCASLLFKPFPLPSQSPHHLPRSRPSSCPAQLDSPSPCPTLGQVSLLILHLFSLSNSPLLCFHPTISFTQSTSSHTSFLSTISSLFCLKQFSFLFYFLLSLFTFLWWLDWLNYN